MRGLKFKKMIKNNLNPDFAVGIVMKGKKAIKTGV
jgi:hypothetical protein